MKTEKKRRLEANGWAVSTTEDFLGLSPEEAALVNLRLNLADAVRKLRLEKNLTQHDLAKRLGSSQSRVAKVEAAEESVSLDLLIRAYLALGASNTDLARAVGGEAKLAG